MKHHLRLTFCIINQKIISITLICRQGQWARLDANNHILLRIDKESISSLILVMSIASDRQTISSLSRRCISSSCLPENYDDTLAVSSFDARWRNWFDHESDITTKYKLTSLKISSQRDDEGTSFRLVWYLIKNNGISSDGPHFNHSWSSEIQNLKNYSFCRARL